MQYFPIEDTADHTSLAHPDLDLLAKSLYKLCHDDELVFFAVVSISPVCLCQSVGWSVGCKPFSLLVFLSLPLNCPSLQSCSVPIKHSMLQ